MQNSISRRRFIAGLSVLSFIKSGSASAASPKFVDFDDPFLGQTTQGDLILWPQKTVAAGKLPAKPEFFGIVRKTNVVENERDAGKINLLAIYAAFGGLECRVSLCSLNTLADNAALPARTAYEALTAIAQKLKARPDFVYSLQDVDKLTRLSCAKSGSRSVIVWQQPKPRAALES